MLFASERREVARFMRRLYRQRLTTTSGGNISLRIDAKTIAITPAALDKGRLRGRDVALVTPAGKNLTPELRLTSEASMHLRILEVCPHINAVVHAHPPIASAFTASSTPINCEILSEPYALVGKIVIAPYALTATRELADLVAEAAQQANAILMKNHGVTALGATLLQAYDRLELIETAAQMTLTIKQLDGVELLTTEQKHELDRLMGRE